MGLGLYQNERMFGNTQMQEMLVMTYPIDKSEILSVLAANNIQVNEYAKVYMAHPHFQTDGVCSNIAVVLCSLQELSLESGSIYSDILLSAGKMGLYPCLPSTGLFLRLSYLNQPQSNNNVLSGVHCAPESAVTVFSKPLEKDDSFPKGLYLRNVDGTLWLRGYVCDEAYPWASGDIFAFEKRTQ